VLADAADTIERFFSGGVMELKEKLGPINWQFMATKKFDPADFEAFLKLLPKLVDGREMRHVVELRHDSFRCVEFVALAREHGVAVVLAGDSDYPQIADLTASFVYARIMGTREAAPLAYSRSALDLWAARVKYWAVGTAPPGLPTIVAHTVAGVGRDVYLYVISGHKVRNPAPATALIKRVS